MTCTWVLVGMFVVAINFAVICSMKYNVGNCSDLLDVVSEPNSSAGELLKSVKLLMLLLKLYIGLRTQSRPL